MSAQGNARSGLLSDTSKLGIRKRFPILLVLPIHPRRVLQDWSNLTIRNCEMASRRNHRAASHREICTNTATVYQGQNSNLWISPQLRLKMQSRSQPKSRNNETMRTAMPSKSAQGASTGQRWGQVTFPQTPHCACYCLAYARFETCLELRKLTAAVYRPVGVSHPQSVASFLSGCRLVHLPKTCSTDASSVSVASA